MTELSHNPLTGERLRWHVTSQETDGRFARAEVWTEPGGGVPDLHLHPWSEERFEVLSGALDFTCGARRSRVAAGGSVRLPAGVPHGWAVHGDQEAHFFVEIEDPRGTDELLETVFALARETCRRRRSRMSLPATGALLDGHLDLARPCFPPLAVLRVLVPLLARVARITGDAARVERARAEARGRLATPPLPVAA